MIDTIVQRKRIMFALGAVVFLISLAGIRLLEVNNDYRSFIGESNRYLQNTDWLSERQGNARESAVLLYKPSNADVLDSLSLLQYSQVAETAPSLPYVVSATSALDQEKLVIVRETSSGEEHIRRANIMFGANVFAENGRDALRQTLASTPTVARRYMAEDFASAAVLISLDFSQDELSREAQISALEEAVDDLERGIQELAPDDRVLIAGSSLFDKAASQTVREDLRSIVPIAALFVFVVLILIYRSFAFAVVTMIIVLIPVLGSAGLIAYLGIPFSNLAMAGLLLVGTLSVADVLHVANTYFLKRAEKQTQSEGLTAMLSQNMTPVIATTVTTILGQMALVLSPAEPIRAMAWIVIVGSVLALLLAILMLPLFLSWIKPPKGDSLTRLSRVLSQLSVTAVRHSKKVLSVAAIVSFGALAALISANVSDSLAGWFSEDTEFNQGLSILDEQYLGGDTITIAVEATALDVVAARNHPQPSAIIEYYATLQDNLEQRYSGLWMSIPTMAKALAGHKGRDGTGTVFETSTIQDDANLSALKRFSAEAVARSGLMTKYAAGKADYGLWRFDGDDASSFTVLANAQDIEAEFLGGDQERRVRVSGMGVAIAELSVRNFDSILKGSVISFVTVSIVMFLVFRSLRFGAVALIPNAIPILLAFGAWALYAGDLNLATITVYSVVLGIVVDDTIHITAKYSRELKSTPNDPLSAIERAVQKCGVGIFATTIIIGVGFALLGTSDFLLTAHRSQLAAIAVFGAFLFDITALPVLLVYASKKKARQQRVA